jgi:CDP-4-dehydro-6-deoxyglucose reductase
VPGNAHHATLSERRVLARECHEYRFTLDEEDAGLRWRGGQFISLNVGHADDGTAILRSYSLASRPASAPAAAVITLVVKLLPQGPASDWFRAAAPGVGMRFTGPMGFFCLDLAHGGDVVLCATGTGIAPFVPMVDELLERDEPGRVLLLWGLRDEGDLFYGAELAERVARSAGRLSVTTALTRPTAAHVGPRGRITPLLFDLLPSLSRPTFYLCGNGAMIRDVKAGLVERGVDRKRQIRAEAFFD